MKKGISKVFLVLFFIIFIFSVSQFAQAASFSSVADGNWNDGATWGNTSPGTEGVDFPGVSDSSTVQNSLILQQNTSVDNVTTTDSGTLDLNDHTLNISGNFTNNGTFTADTGTVNFVGTNQIISGTNTFYNLTKNTTTADTLFFTGGTQTVTGTLNLSGASGNLLTVSGSSFNNFHEDLGVAVDTHGNIYIADNFSGRVVVLNPDGTPKNVYTGSDISSLPGSPTNGFGKDPGPNGIAVDSHGKIYVADVANNRIVVLNSDGTAHAVYTGDDISSLPGSPSNGFNGAQGVSVDSVGNIYVSDTFSHRIVVLNPDGSAKAVYTGSDISSLPGSPNASFSSHNVAFDSEGNMYLSDEDNDRIVVLNPDGTAKAVYTGDDVSSLPGTPPNDFNNVKGVAVDSHDNIYVVDTGNARVVVLNPDGTAKAVYDGGDISSLPGSPSNGFGSDFPGINGITLDSAGNIYVANPSDNRVVVLNPDGTAKAVYDGSDISSVPVNWTLDPQGPVSVSYLNVVKSENLGDTQIDCTNGCVDGGGNTKWKFSTIASPVHHSVSGGSIVAARAVNLSNINIPAVTPTPPSCPTGDKFNGVTGLPCTTGATLSSAPTTSCTITTTLKIGSKGVEVKCLQTILKITSDGIFGPQTKAAVISFQKNKNLTPDGIVGPKTTASMMSGL